MFYSWVQPCISKTPERQRLLPPKQIETPPLKFFIPSIPTDYSWSWNTGPSHSNPQPYAFLSLSFVCRKSKQVTFRQVCLFQQNNKALKAPLTPQLLPALEIQQGAGWMLLLCSNSEESSKIWGVTCSSLAKLNTSSIGKAPYATSARKNKWNILRRNYQKNIPSSCALPKL